MSLNTNPVHEYRKLKPRASGWSFGKWGKAARLNKEHVIQLTSVFVCSLLGLSGKLFSLPSTFNPRL